MTFSVDLNSDRPLYKQITEQIEKAVRSGALAPGSLLPSMNILAADMNISKETVKKAYAILRDKGVLTPRQGKGFYVTDPKDSDKPLSILVLFDKISIYKQVLFNAFAAEMGSAADITILTHNQSTQLLDYYLNENLDNFDYYVITPHFPMDAASQETARRLISRVPNRKLVVLDRLIPGMSGNFGAVYQDFENDVYYGLTEGLDRLRSTSELKVITLPDSLYGRDYVSKGVERFSKDFGVPVSFYASVPGDIHRNDTFLLINSQLDDALVDLSRKIKNAGLRVGADVRIISYNEFAFNEVVLGGLTTISTDFREMGRLAARIILDRKPSKIHCPFRMTRRSTF